MGSGKDKTLEDIDALFQQANVIVLFQQASGHFQVGRLTEAETLAQEILSLNPDHAEANMMLGMITGQRGQYELAVQLINRAIRSNPGMANYYNSLGYALQGGGHLEEALAAYEQATQLSPRFMDAQNNRGYVLRELGRLDEALMACESMARLKPDSSEVHSNRGALLRDLGRLEEALEACDLAIRIKPGYSGAHFNRGMVLMEQGRLEDAEASYRRALELDPDQPDVYRVLMNIHKAVPGDELFSVMEGYYSRRDAAPESRMYLGFALGKAYHDIQCYSKAIPFYQEANKLKRATFRYHLEDDKNNAVFLKNMFTPEFISRNANVGEADDTPIFIVGMPRSGTTLVEQILASHPQIAGGGELPFVGELTRQNPLNAGQHGLAWLTNPEPGALREKGREYLQQLRDKGGTQARHVTDKLPLNFWYIGLIRLILPKARIINLRRDPRDNCLSIYTNYFASHNPYAYDLKELGAYYRLYVTLMEHWHHVFPGAIYEVTYEDLVHDLESEVRRLLEYCGQPFDKRCLDFHETRRAVQTISLSQVREPLYRGSVGRWKPYERMLQPLLSILKEP